jgi:hypothetical protein
MDLKEIRRDILPVSIEPIVLNFAGLAITAVLYSELTYF